MNVLVIGSGGREHALCWKIRQSPKLSGLFAVPGSDAIGKIADRADLQISDFENIHKFCLDNKIDLAVVGPELPLSIGISDYLVKRGVKTFGPVKAGARLEYSKEFAKEFMERNSIPTAQFRSFDDPRTAEREIKKMKFPLVIKADGLCAGKGVRICFEEKEALNTLDDFMVKKIFGENSSRIIVEEFLMGDEASVMAFTDGKDYLMLPVSRDHKRVWDNNEGPNTGGMGAVCPVPLDGEILLKIENEVIKRFVEGLKKEGIHYKGIIYAGIMLTKTGPKVLEFNVRFGDPEIQAVLPLVEGDFLDILLSAAEGKLAAKKIALKDDYCVCVVLASRGYPENPDTGKEITGVEDLENSDEIMFFHAGTKYHAGKWLTAGGRVLNIAATGKTVDDARQKIYFAATRINFAGMHYRKDIGLY